MDNKDARHRDRDHRVALNLDRLETGRSVLELDAELVREDQVVQGHRVPGFTARVLGELDVDAMDQKVLIHGEFEATREMVCDRSGEPFELGYPVKVEIIVLRTPGRGRADELGQEVGEDDNWVLHQPGGPVDLTDALLEAVVLDKPLHVVHPDYQEPVDTSISGDSLSGSGQEEDAIDPRWDALRQLRESESDSGKDRN